MTQEDIKLFRIDVAARLPYEPIITNKKFDGNYGHRTFLGDLELYKYFDSAYIEDTKIYLRPMSSMTEEEREEYNHIAPGLCVVNGIRIPNANQIDWFNTHHFDWRGLIEKGPALKAPVGMYDINKKDCEESTRQHK